MPSIGVQRAKACTADRVVWIDALVAHCAQVGLMTSISDAELVRAREDVTRRVRQRVEALQLETIAKARVSADVDAVVLRGAIAHLGEREQAAILHDTAARLYRI